MPLPSYLWFVPILPALGIAIDFLLGKVGQARVRSFLEEAWIRFGDVRWSNFGRSEAIFAHDVLGLWFGRRLFSVRRWTFVAVFFSIVYVTGAAIVFILHGSFNPIVHLNFEAILTYSLDALVLALSVSYARGVSRIIAALSGNSSVRNVIVFLILVVIIYSTIVFWVPSLKILRIFFVFMFTQDYHSPLTLRFWIEPFVIAYYMHQVFATAYTPTEVLQEAVLIFKLSYVVAEKEGLLDSYPIHLVSIVAGYFSNYLRLLISVIFVGSFVGKPLIIRPISLVWLRIVQSDKPVFTLVLSGIGGVILVVGTILNHIG